MAETGKAEERVGFLVRTRRAPSPPARGLRERCKLPQWCPGQSPGRNRFWCISKLVEGIKTVFTTKRDTVSSTPRANLVTNSRSVSVCLIFPWNFGGCSKTQNTPLVTALARTVYGRVYVTARCPSVHLYHVSTAVAAWGGFAAGRPVGRQCQSTAAQRTCRNGSAAANVTRVTFTAAAEGKKQTCYWLRLWLFRAVGQQCVCVSTVSTKWPSTYTHSKLVHTFRSCSMVKLHVEIYTAHLVHSS